MSTSSGGSTGTYWECPHRDCKKVIPGVAQDFQFPICPFCKRPPTVEATTSQGSPKHSTSGKCYSLKDQQASVSPLTFTHTDTSDGNHPEEANGHLTDTQPDTSVDPLTSEKVDHDPLTGTQQNIMGAQQEVGVYPNLPGHASNPSSSSGNQPEELSSSQGTGSAGEKPLPKQKISTEREQYRTYASAVAEDSKVSNYYRAKEEGCFTGILDMLSCL